MENSNHHAGSATGIDLSELPQLETLAAQVRDMREFHPWNLGQVHKLASKTLALIALARATPQHPEGPSDVAKMGEELKVAPFNLSPHMAYAIAKKYATPQHSVTEQVGWQHAANEWADTAYNGLQHLRNIEDALSAGRTLNVKADRENMERCCQHAKQVADAVPRTQPEQAEEYELYDQWQHDRLFSTPPKPVGPFDAWQARAALAIPASAAAEPHALRDGYTGSTLVSDFAGPKITLRYATTTQAEAAHVLLCAMIDSPAASEQQAGADELRESSAALLAYLDAHEWGGIPEGATAERLRAALTHRATTAPVIPQCRHCDVEPGEVHHGDCPDRAERVFMPAYHANTADQQGDTASECVYVSLQADSLDDWERYVFETCSKAQNIYDLHIRIGDQEWKGSLREVMAALQGAAQAQAGDAPALLRGAVGSVAFVADGLPRVNWMRPERIEAGTLLYVIDRAAMAAPATTGGSNV